MNVLLAYVTVAAIVFVIFVVLYVLLRIFELTDLPKIFVTAICWPATVYYVIVKIDEMRKNITSKRDLA